ncbi:MAG TPA: phosphoglycerate mutase family protein [Gammaproteobacteria bacterium]|nr:phosphoglycerate mutase family protein [Gammaproteobacteria bacterium]
MTTVLVVRHAEAEEAAEAARAGRSENARRLTPDGARQMKKGARGLATLVDTPAVILSSPLTRAVETAGLLAEAFPAAKLERHVRLAPGFDPAALLHWAGRYGAVMLVGHEPDLSQWIGYAVSGEPRSLVRMKKGSVCRLDMPASGHAGEAEIVWLLTLKQLAALA